jgi:U3 small nucleolar RNA-associated protein 20
MTDLERNCIIDLMLAPFQNLKQNNSTFSIINGVTLAPMKKQIGFLNVCLDFIKQLRSLVSPSLPSILGTILHLLHFAELNTSSTDIIEKRQLREVRQLSIKRISLLFTIDLDFDFAAYIPTLFSSCIVKRISLFSVENTQSPSSLLELFGAWSKDIKYVFYLIHNPEVIPQILKLLTATKVHDSVVLFVLSMVENIQELGDSDKNLVSRIFEHNTSLLLDQFQALLLKFNAVHDIKIQGNSIPNRIIGILSRFSPYMQCIQNSSQLVSILVPYLKKPTRSISESTKSEILHIFYNFLKLLSDSAEHNEIRNSYYSTVCRLFGSLESRASRIQLINVYQEVSKFSGTLIDMFDLLQDLNAFSVKRMDEFDFDRRFTAYSSINQVKYEIFTCLEWMPILYHFVFDIRNPDEYSIRTSASFGMIRFIEQAFKNRSVGFPSISNDTSFYSLLTHVLIPSVKKGLKNDSVQVRTEFVQVLGNIVLIFKDDDSVSDMACLVDDKESNFFENIYHLQNHRQTRALKNIGKICSEFGRIKPSNIMTIFIPIISHFIFECDLVKDHNMINEAIASLAGCTGGLTFNHYDSTLRRYMNAIERRPLLEKVLIRLLIQILNHFHFEFDDESLKVDNGESDSNLHKTNIIIHEVEDTEEYDVPGELDAVDEVEAKDSLSKNTQTERMRSIISEKLLPKLQSLISARNDETICHRIPLAIAITRLLQKLQTEAMEKHLPKMLATLCNILSSHVQSARDSARETLVTISTMLGPSYLSFIISCLKTSLKRGYQLHILGFTLNAILSANVNVYTSGSIESCIQPIVEICINDIFGEPGKERQVQELKSKMREIKSSKRFLQYLF